MIGFIGMFAFAGYALGEWQASDEIVRRANVVSTGESRGFDTIAGNESKILDGQAQIAALLQANTTLQCLYFGGRLDEKGMANEAQIDTICQHSTGSATHRLKAIRPVPIPELKP